MSFRTRLKNPTVMMQLGMMFLVFGMLSIRFLRPSPMLSENLTDGITGLFYGIAIALLLTSVWKRRRPHSTTDAGRR